ncbi:ribokinase [Ferrimonas aestuarii]|uniref:Ribokinase n=1 Tax=Ferrimonas aestuarii TaxID=2569539 RepID=A0A4U1BLX2_9GAMM|nr:ribokinase [Ferrimonas aestuarii]TKB54308.1 ribokinase [Ferrimonas aestuarii]
MAAAQPKLTVLGSINVDHLLQVDAFPRPGETLTANQYDIVGGGKGANQAVAATKLGANVSMIGCVGKDAIGSQFVADFSAMGMDVSGIEAIEGAATGLAMIYVDANGENNIGIWPGANALLTKAKAAEHQSLIQDADLLLMQLESPIETLIEAAKLAKAAATQVILNPAPAKALPEELLEHVDMLTPNETEAELLTGIKVETLEDAQRAANKLHSDYGIKQVLITLGKRGVWLSQDGQGQQIEGFSVEAKDTTAAGDTFHGGLVTALLEGKPLIDAIVFGQGAAALSVTQMGAQSSIPSRQQTEQFLAEN